MDGNKKFHKAPSPAFNVGEKRIDMYGENILDKLEGRLKKWVGFDVPTALTSEGWAEYNARYKREHPIMHFTFDVIIKNVELSLYCWIANPWREFWYGLRQRFITRPTEVNIQGLSKYCYHNPAEILLHANFQILVDFVEWEVCIHDRPKWYRVMRAIPILGYFVPTLREPEKGLKHLKWEASLICDSSWGKEGDENWGKPIPQAICAQEKLDLYLWWKNVRPTRIDPMDLSGLGSYYERPGRLSLHSMTDEERNEWIPLHDECARIEKMYEDEDEEMLHKLVHIRQSLWA